MSAVLLGLLCLGDPGAVERLVSPHRAEREAGIRELARHGAGEVAALVDHADPRVGLGAIEALAYRGTREVVPALLAAAGHADPERGGAAARALIRVAGQELVALDALPAPSPAIPRIARAAAAAAEERLAVLTGAAGFDLPQLYRTLFACGTWAAPALAAIARDPAVRGTTRAHAVVAYARVAGEGSLPDLAALLDDPDPAVRGAAATMLVRWEAVDSYGRLAAMLGRGGATDPVVRRAAVTAVRRGGRPTADGCAELESLVGTLAHLDACAAADALAEVDPVRARTAVSLRVRHILRSERAASGAGCGAALFVLHAPPPEDDCLEAIRGHGDALLRAAIAARPDEALALARTLLAPVPDDSSREIVRVQVVATLLVRHGAPWADRVAFAGPLLATDASFLRRWGASVLHGAPAASLEPLVPALRALLGDASEAVRVAGAAALAARAPADATRALLLALYDGDPVASAVAARALATARPDLDVPGPGAPVRERRRFAAAALGAEGGKE